MESQTVGVDLCLGRRSSSGGWRGRWRCSVSYSSGGGPTRLWDVGVHRSGDPDLSIRIIEVETRTGEALCLDALHACAISLVAVMGHGSHRILLEAELLPLHELPLPLLL
jgi:hypothetical protein